MNENLMLEFEAISRNELPFQKEKYSLEEQKAYSSFLEVKVIVQDLIKFKKDESKLRSDLKEISAEYFSSSGVKTKHETNNYRPYKIAAIFIFITLSSMLLLKHYATENYSTSSLLNDLILQEKTISRSTRTDDFKSSVEKQFAEGDYNAVITTLSKENMNESKNPQFMLMLGASYFHVKDYLGAIKIYENLLNFDEVYIHEYYLNKIICYLHLGDIKNARQLCKTALTDKSIINNYPFLKIEKVLNHPLRNFTD